MPQIFQRLSWWWVATATAACIAAGLWLVGSSMAAARLMGSRNGKARAAQISPNGQDMTFASRPSASSSNLSSMS